MSVAQPSRRVLSLGVGSGLALGLGLGVLIGPVLTCAKDVLAASPAAKPDDATKASDLALLGIGPDADIAPDVSPGTGFREFPIGEAERHHMRIAALWLPPVTMEGMAPPMGEHVLHLECDVASLRENPNGFALGEWVPYLALGYEILRGDKLITSGRLHPMVAKDGPHYGATIQMPGPGKYRLRYSLKPPKVNGFGRHTDPITGVAPWWKPFRLEFDWDYQP